MSQVDCITGRKKRFNRLVPPDDSFNWGRLYLSADWLINWRLWRVWTKEKSASLLNLQRAVGVPVLASSTFNRNWNCLNLLQWNASKSFAVFFSLVFKFNILWRSWQVIQFPQISTLFNLPLKKCCCSVCLLSQQFFQFQWPQTKSLQWTWFLRSRHLHQRQVSFLFFYHFSRLFPTLFSYDFLRLMI